MQNKTGDIAGQIYMILADAKIARFAIGELIDDYFSESDDEFAGTSEDLEQLRLGYARAWSRASIAGDYIVRIAEALKALEASLQGE